jgi:hypothetical protein
MNTEPTIEAAREHLCNRLLADHRRIEFLASSVIAALEASDPTAASNAWNRFEPALLAHFDQEELHLLPAFEAGQPAECAALRAEHSRFRTALGELGVAIDLHLADQRNVRELVDRLHAHAAREDALLYRWADRSAPAHHVRAILSRLSGSR